jgi:hypothetical protein
MHMKNDRAGRFCACPETFTLIYEILFGDNFVNAPISTAGAGFDGNQKCKMRLFLKFVQEVCRDSISPKRFSFRYNLRTQSRTMRP